MNLQNYLQSNEFIKILELLKKNKIEISHTSIGYLVNLSIKYSILFSDNEILMVDGLNEFLENVTKYIIEKNIDMFGILNSFDLDNYIAELCIGLIYKKLNISIDKQDDIESKRKIVSLLLKLRGVIYHAFNSAFYESIKEHGLNPNVKFTPQEDIDKIDEIFKKYGVNMICGWQKKNCETMVSYSETPSVSYYYAICSPEWFSQFTGAGTPFNPNTEYYKHAFIEGDYEAAKQNLLKLMNEKNFSLDDLQFVIDFFEENWNIYGQRKPMLVIIMPKNSEEFITNMTNRMLDPASHLNSIKSIFRYCFNSTNKDLQTTEIIDTTDAIFIELPSYKQLHNKLYFDLNGSYARIIRDKLIYLQQARIRINDDGEWISDNGIQEVEKVKEILHDDLVFKAIVTNLFGNEFSLSGWIGYFDDEVLTKVDNISLVEKYKPGYLYILVQKLNNNSIKKI